MTLTRIPLLALAILMAFVSNLGAQNNLLENVTSNINIEGLETTFDPDTGIATANGNVHIKYGNTEITAGHADYNSNTGDVIARQDATVWKDGITYKGENLMYNIKTNELTGNAIRSGLGHGGGSIYYSTEKFETETKFIDRIDGGLTYLTTHDYENPNYRVKCKSMTIYPDDRIIMRNITVYVNKTPVFWLPYLVQPLDDELGYKFTPGYSTLWGAFLLNQWGVIHGDHTLAKYHFDLRSARGVAGGADFISLRHKDNQENFGTLKFYVASDSDGQATTGAGTRSTVVDSTRYRVNFQHRIYLPGPEESTWYMDFDLNKMSDIHFYEDYFLDEFRRDREPDNQISLVHTNPKYVATLMGEFRVNDFYRTDTRLPELSFDFTRHALGNSNFFYQGSTSAGILKEKYTTEEEAKFRSSLDTLKSQVDEPGFNRFHTYHEFLYPKTFGGWLNVVPRIGGGMTYYGDVSGSKNETSSDLKGIFHAGVDISFKATKTWDDVQNQTLGLDGLRHVIRPYLNYSYLNANQNDGVPSIDRLSLTTRPRTIDVPMFTAIDDLRSWNVARVGVQQLFQTKRDYQSFDASQAKFLSASSATTQTYNWAGINTFVDLFAEDPEYDRSISNLYNEVFWRPVPWVNFFADTQLPIGSSDFNFTELNHGITWLPTDKLSVTLQHQYIVNHPFLQDSSRITSVVYARMSENWGLSMTHTYEMDDGIMQYQSYALHRDLSSWVMTLGLRLLDNKGGKGDTAVLLSFTLKDFPQVSLPVDGAQTAVSNGHGGF